MKTLNSLAAVTAVVIMASALWSIPASAADQKVNHAMACVPLSPQTTFDDLYYRPAGVKNITGASQYVVCPLLVDADSVSNWTATDGQAADLTVTFHAAEAGEAICEVSIGSNLDGTKATFSGSTSYAAGEVMNVAISSIHGDAVSSGFMFNYPVSLYCKMPPQSTILRIRLIERNVDTDSSTL